MPVVMIHIDVFNRNNDHYGYPVGGTDLQRVAAAIKDASKGRDFAARLAGKEFAVIITNRDSGILHWGGERTPLAVEQLDL